MRKKTPLGWSRISAYFQFLKGTFTHFSDDDGVKLSASLSYYTLFSIAPFLIIIISVAGAVFGKEAVAGKVYFHISRLIGTNASLQVQEIIKNVQENNKGGWGSIFGIILLVIGATGVFTEIQSSINYMWGVRTKPKKGWLKLIINRLISFSLVISMGFLLLVTLMLNSLLDIFYNRLKTLLPDEPLNLFYLFNWLGIIVITVFLFTLVFKILPDAKIRWKDSIVGAFFTTLLFMCGKFLIGYYIGNSSFNNVYGTAASVIVILLWVYYTSIILYLGAAFTYQYAYTWGTPIAPSSNSVYIV